MTPRATRAARVLGAVVGAVLGLVVLANLLEGVLDYFSLSLDIRLVAQSFITRPQVLGVALVGIEEGGVPLPISGDILILYSASRAGRNPSALLTLGLAFEVAVLVGSTFLFFVSRRWGRRLLRGEAGRALGLTPERINRVEGWFERWGIWAVIFGRQVPGFRVAVTVVAASFGLDYRIFITGVTIAAAIWVTLFMALGLLVGPEVESLLSAHQSSSLLILGGVLLVSFIFIVGRLTWRRRRRPPRPESVG
jgi:membrane protein DedA with SNARE-associated domain